MEQKKKKDILTSPKGVAKFPHLTVPQTKAGNKTMEPTYSVTLLLDPNDDATVKFRALIEAAHVEGLAEAKKANKGKTVTDTGVSNMFKDDTTKEGEPTGKLGVRFKLKAEVKSQKDGKIYNFKPALFDVRGASLPLGASIYGGSVIKVGYTINHNLVNGLFYTSLRLEAVQGLVIKSSYEKEASAFGFVNEDSENAFGEQADAAVAGAEAPADF